jgi:hypothetical protein
VTCVVSPGWRVLLQFDGFSWPHVTVATLELNLP